MDPCLAGSLFPVSISMCHHSDGDFLGSVGLLKKECIVLSTMTVAACILIFKNHLHLRTLGAMCSSVG